MRRPTPVFAALAVVCATALAACAPTSTTSPKDPIGYRCPGPTPGAPEQTCSQAEYEQAERRAAQLREAQVIYGELIDERNRLYNAGGATEATPALVERATGEYLLQIVGLLRYQHERGERRTGSLKVVAAQELAPGDDALVALSTCEDGRGAEVYDSDGKFVDHGALIHAKSYFMMSEGKMKVFRGTARAVDQCPF